jgi:hypothetical protein
MDSDTESNPNIENIIYNDDNHMDGGFDTNEYYSSDDENELSGGALPVNKKFKTSAYALLSHKYETKIQDGEEIIHPRDLMFLAARIKPIHEQISISNISGEFTKIRYKGFYRLYYQTMYHLKMLIIEVNKQNEYGIHRQTKQVVDYRPSAGDEKIKAHFLNSQFVKSSKFQDSKYGKNEKAQYLTQLCSQARGSAGDMNMKIQNRPWHRGYKKDEKAISNTDEKFKADINTVFESINHIQPNLKIDYTINNLKCMIYYIRYHQIAFNYYFEQLLKVYKIILGGNYNNNIVIFTEIKNSENDKKIIDSFGGNDHYNIIRDKFNEMVTNPTQKLANDKLSNALQQNDADSVYKEIMDNMNNKDKNNNLETKDIKNEYIYLFILFTYLTKRAFSNAPEFFNTTTKITELKRISTKRDNFLYPKNTSSSAGRLGILLCAIPSCMQILVNHIIIYKNIIDKFKKNTGINHLANIVPDMYGIKNIYSKLTRKSEIKEGSKVIETTTKALTPYNKNAVTKLEREKKNIKTAKYYNKILFASYFVDCLIMELFADLIYDGNQIVINDKLSKIYNRLLKTSFNTKISVNDNIDINTQKKLLKKLLDNEITGLKEDMLKKGYILFDSKDNAKNINDCFDNLYKCSIELLLNTPIIIYRYEKLNQFSKFFFTAPRDTSFLWLTKWLRNHPNIDKDIASMSNNAIKTLTNLFVGIELGIYDFEKNITFTRNSESVFSSLPLYFEKIFSKKIYNDKPANYLLSTHIYDNNIDLKEIKGLDKFNGNNTTLTSLEASTLTLEEIINLWYAKYYESNRKVLPVLKGGADETKQQNTEVTEQQKPDVTEQQNTEVTEQQNTVTSLANLAKTFGSLSSNTKQTGGAKIVPNVIAKLQSNENKMFETLQSLLVSEKGDTTKSHIDSEVNRLKKNLPDGKEDLARMLLNEDNFKYMFDMANIYNQGDPANDSDDVKATRKLLIETMNYKIEFMKKRLIELMTDTPDITSTTTFNDYRKLWKITLSKAMILLKMKQYIDDIAKIISTDKIISTSPENKDKGTIDKYNIDYFNNFLANYALNSAADISIKLSGGTKTIFKFNIDKPIVINKNIFKQLLKIADPTFRMIVEKEYKDLTQEQKKYKYEDFKALKAQISNIGDAISFKDGGNEKTFPRIKDDTPIKFNETLITTINDLAAAGADNPIKTALAHFWKNVDGKNMPASKCAVKDDYTDFEDDSNGDHKWHFSLQSNIAKIKTYFLEDGENVFEKDETKDIDPVLMYKINMFILQKYNEAMKYCIDNFLMLNDKDNPIGFVGNDYDADENENVETNFAEVLKDLVKMLNILASRKHDKDTIIADSNNIIEYDAGSTGQGEFQKHLCEKMSKYYLMVSVIRSIEYMFQKLTEANEALIKTELDNNTPYNELRKQIADADYQAKLTEKLDEIMTEANNAAAAAATAADVAAADVAAAAAAADADAAAVAAAAAAADDLKNIKEKLIGYGNPVPKNTLKKVKIEEFETANFNAGDIKVKGQLISNAANAKLVLDEAVENLFMAITTDMKDKADIKEAKNAAIDIKKMLHDVNQAVDNVLYVKQAVVAAYDKYKDYNNDRVKNALNECMYVSVAIAGLGINNVEGNNQKLFDSKADKYEAVNITKMNNAHDSQKDLENFNYDIMKGIIEYILHTIADKIDGAFTKLGQSVLDTVKEIVDDAAANIDKKKIDDIKTDIDANVIIGVDPVGGNPKYPITALYGVLDGDDAASAAAVDAAKDIEFINVIKAKILDLDSIKSKVTSYNIQNMMANDLMKNILQFTRYVYPNKENILHNVRMITLLTDAAAAPPPAPAPAAPPAPAPAANILYISHVDIKPAEDFDDLFYKQRNNFILYLNAIYVKDAATIYDKFNMAYMLNYAKMNLHGFISSLKMSDSNTIPSGVEYKLAGDVEIKNIINTYVIPNIFMYDDKVVITVTSNYLPTAEKPTLPELPKFPDIPNLSEPVVDYSLQAIEYAKNSNMLWLESGNNGSNACWINSAIAAVLADKRIVAHLRDTYNAADSVNEDLYSKETQIEIMKLLKEFADDNTNTQWTNNKYKLLLDELQKYKPEGKVYDMMQDEINAKENVKLKKVIDRDYDDAFHAMRLLMHVLQKGRFREKKLVFRYIYGNNLSTDNFNINIINTVVDKKIVNPDNTYTLLSVIVPDICDDGSGMVSHFTSYAKINTNDKNIDKYWIKTDLLPGKSSAVSTDGFNKTLKCDENKIRTVYAIYIKNDAYDAVKKAANPVPALGGGISPLKKSSKTLKNRCKRTTLTGKNRKPRCCYPNMYKGANKSMNNKTQKAAKRFTKTGKRN